MSVRLRAKSYSCTVRASEVQRSSVECQLSLSVRTSQQPRQCPARVLYVAVSHSLIDTFYFPAVARQKRTSKRVRSTLQHYTNNEAQAGGMRWRSRMRAQMCAATSRAESVAASKPGGR